MLRVSVCVCVFRAGLDFEYVSCAIRFCFACQEGFMELCRV